MPLPADGWASKSTAHVGAAGRRSLVDSSVLRELEVSNDILGHPITELLINLGLAKQVEQALFGEQAAPDELPSKNLVLLAACGILGNCQIVRLEAQAFDAVGVSDGQIDQPSLPTFGKRRGTQIDWIGVIPKVLVKWRQMANRIEPFSPGTLFSRDEVDFSRLQNLVSNIGVLSVKRLASNDDELLLASDSAGGTQYMINLLLLH
jgi:hypothetical protein